MASSFLSIQKGNPYIKILQVYDASVSPRVAYDLTGKTIFFTVKHRDDISTDDTLAVITKTITVHTDPVAGTSSLELTAVQTAIAAGDYKYDIRIYDDDPLIQMNSVQGLCEVVDIVTKRIS
jgi:hypothetical protein